MAYFNIIHLSMLGLQIILLPSSLQTESS